MKKTEINGYTEEFLQNYDFSKYQCPNCFNVGMKYHGMHWASDEYGDSIEGTDILLFFCSCKFTSSIHEDDLDKNQDRNYF